MKPIKEQIEAAIKALPHFADSDTGFKEEYNATLFALQFTAYMDRDWETSSTY